MADPLSGATAVTRGANGHADRAMLHPQRAREQDGGRRGRRDAARRFVEVWEGVSLDDRLVRSNGAPETRPCETEFCVRRNEIGLDQPERLHRFDDADQRQLASRVTRDGRFDRHPRARQHIGGECRLPVAGWPAVD